MDAARSWAEQLDAWAMPREVLEGAEDSPWVLPREMFTRRADRDIESPIGATFEVASRALERPGTVLDIGAAAGATGLPLAGWCPVESITAVDGDPELLAAFRRRAEKLDVPAVTVCGRWPDVAGGVDVADVVLAGNVVYNVAELVPFARALSAHARRLVVVETAARHPLTELNPLWKRFHGITRPAGPTAEDCVAVLSEAGIEPEVTHWRRPPEAEYPTFGELVDVTRRRLCLPASAADEVERALLASGADPRLPPDLGSSGRELVTLAWPGEAGQG